ncbi:MAG: hypothetical protein AB1715_00095 [Acidobacteriota bacterium]
MKIKAALGYVVLAAFVMFAFPSCTKTPSPEELKASVEIVEVSSKWVSKEYQPWPPKLTLVPTISFRVKNASAKPLNYMNFNAIFKERDDQENLGDNFLAAIRKQPILPGETSHVITLKSNFGVEGKSLASFKDNPQWKPVICRLFIQSKGSPHVLLGEYDISRTIDFQEPEPVGTEKKKEEKKN